MPRLADLALILAALAAAAHVAYVARGGALLHGGVQAPIWEEARYAEDAALLDGALAEAPPATGRGPDLVILALGGVRAAMWPPDGGRVAQATAGGVHLADHRSVAPHPEPALATLATGLLPSEHGAVRGSLGAQRPMDTRPATLAGRLSEAGWRTVSLSAARDAGSLLLDRGFQVRLSGELPPGAAGLPHAQGDRIAELALHLLAQRGPEPLFLQLTFLDGELPWLIRQGFFSREVALPEALPPGGRLRRSAWGKRSRAVLSGERPAHDREREAWTVAYRSALWFLDREVGRVLEALGPDTIVIVVGLNGTELGEAGLVGSGRDVRETSLHTPLWVRTPEAWDPSGLDSLEDLAPWLLAGLGLPPLAPPRLPAPEGVRVAELHSGRAEADPPALGRALLRSRRAFREGDHVVVISGDHRHEAFDLAEDPAQSTEVQDAARVEDLQARALAWTEAAAAAGGVK